MTLPNFLVIGAAKSGTTSLHFYLGQHPQVFMCPVKEPGFFAFEGQNSDQKDPWQEGGVRRVVTDLQSYQALFRAAGAQPAIGEVSPAYLVRPRAAERIQHYIPQARLIAVLRNPVERAYSAFWMQRLYSQKNVPDFAALVEKRLSDLPQGELVGNLKIDAGFYDIHLKRFYDLFAAQQLRIYLYEDLSRATLPILQDMFSFLEVDAAFQPDISIRHMAGGVPRSRTWRAVLLGMNRLKSVLRPLLPEKVRRRLRSALDPLARQGLEKPPPMPLQTRQMLLELDRQDILRLQQLIARDLSAWLE
jgi:hypothetical protein